MSNPVEVVHGLLRANADASDTRFGMLSDEEVNALVELCNAYTLVELAGENMTGEEL